MNILVIGSGGREHALLWKLDQSPRITKLYAAPGNAGTAEHAENVAISADDIDELLRFAQEKKIDLTVVGPDDPLAAGIVDAFQAAGLKIFGPNAAAAQLEASKSFAKQFMQRYGIPTAASETFHDSTKAHVAAKKATYPLVIKADGLALGKGVVIATTPEEASEAIDRSMVQKVFGEAGRIIVMEEFLTGPECSLHALIGGTEALIFPDARDHKRIFDNDQGPNTGGMGTISPSGILSDSFKKEMQEQIFTPFLHGLTQENLAFHGMLFPGLIMTKEGPKVLEFNCRFGDPETQVLMRRLKSDLLDLLEATVQGTLAEQHPVWDERPAICLILASGGYPGPIEKGKIITGLEAAVATDPDIIIFHAGTKLDGQDLVTNGGRVLGISAIGVTLTEARQKAYAAAALIQFDGKQLRTDVGAT